MQGRSKYRPADVVGVMLLAVSVAVSSLLLFARCLFCQRLECLPSWHRLQLWQRQCTTSPRGRRDLGPRGEEEGWMFRWEELWELNQQQHNASSSSLFCLLSPYAPSPPFSPHSLPESMHNVCCGNIESTCMSVHQCQSKSCHHCHQGLSFPQPKWGGLAPT